MHTMLSLLHMQLTRLLFQHTEITGLNKSLRHRRCYFEVQQDMKVLEPIILMSIDNFSNVVDI